MPSPGRLAPQARPHALAELEVTLAKAKAERDRYREVLLVGEQADDAEAEAEAL
jgi:hypothetical protein